MIITSRDRGHPSQSRWHVRLSRAVIAPSDRSIVAFERQRIIVSCGVSGERCHQEKDDACKPQRADAERGVEFGLPVGARPIPVFEKSQGTSFSNSKRFIEFPCGLKGTRNTAGATAPDRAERKTNVSKIGVRNLNRFRSQGWCLNNLRELQNNERGGGRMGNVQHLAVLEWGYRDRASLQAA